MTRLSEEEWRGSYLESYVGHKSLTKNEEDHTNLWRGTYLAEPLAPNLTGGRWNTCISNGNNNRHCNSRLTIQVGDLIVDLALLTLATWADWTVLALVTWADLGVLTQVTWADWTVLALVTWVDLGVLTLAVLSLLVLAANSSKSPNISGSFRPEWGDDQQERLNGVQSYLCDEKWLN